jgi:hypothetical protein
MGLPCFIAAAATSRAVWGSMVLESTTIVPGLIPASKLFAER